MPEPVTIVLEGATNFRDVSGVATRDGRVLTRGRVYRSNQFSRLTAADLTALEALGIDAVYDLRSTRERTAQPTPRPLGRSADHVSPKGDTDFIFNIIFTATERTAAAWSEAFGRFYAEMPEHYAEEFATVFRLIGQNRLPLVVHCSAGKDRTGVICALIQALVGVDRETIVADYLASSARLRDDRHFTNMLSDAKLAKYAELPKECRLVMLGTSREHIENMLDVVEARHGSVAGYLQERLGFRDADIARMRDLLTSTNRSDL